MTDFSLPRSFLPRQNVKTQNQLLFPFQCYIRRIGGCEVNIHVILVLKLDADDMLCPHQWGGGVADALWMPDTSWMSHGCKISKY